AIGLAALVIHHRDPDAVLAILPSDHTISKPDIFLDILDRAESLARDSDTIVTIGITPRFPETGYGYIRFNPKARVAGQDAFRVMEFKEKPDEQTAARYVASGAYLWNAGMFIARANTILQAFATHLPEDYRRLKTIEAALGTANERAAVDAQFPLLTSISIDFGIMQDYHDTCTIPADFGWNDVGSFRALFDLYEGDDNGNIALGEVISHHARGNLVLSMDKPVALVGVRDLVVINTGDVVLVCHKYEAQNISTLVKRLDENKKYDHLT
ncbi:mannose-1-phosphate guanylyltransferase, partial [bacterium]|nr:mannose-1-phosphate guanylyltransferase [candidate division CSSED10-310 bacterium]